VPGGVGTWKDLTGNVNLMATKLTDRVPMDEHLER
jgi:hypothetical protein